MLSAAVALLAGAASAQLAPDPRDQMKQIADKVASEMKEIDKMLMTGDASKAAAEASRRSAEGIGKMLEGAQTSNKRVQQGIEEMLEQLSKSGL
jgi:hypothetical protein